MDWQLVASYFTVKSTDFFTVYVGPIIVFDARPTGVQLKREAKLSTVIGLITKHADCRITFILYPIRL